VVGIELVGGGGPSELIPRVALGGIHAVRAGELGGHGEFELMSTPQPQRLVDDRAAIEIGMDGDIGVDAGEKVWVERGSDLGTTAGRQANRHADSIPDKVPVTLTVTGWMPSGPSRSGRRCGSGNNG
jgi:hypothetical protein